MLYKFKSKAAADLIMLEPQGRQILEIIGKTPGSNGIITAAQIPGAISSLEAAVAASEALASAAKGNANAGDDEDTPEDGKDAVRLRQRVAPFTDMLRRSAAEDADVVWGF